MNYMRIYNELIDRAKCRTELKEYSEIHHIIPKCLGGKNESSNLVVVTAREHFVAHQLLAKIHGGKLFFAAMLMSGNSKYTSKRYAWIKQKFAAMQSARQIENLKSIEFRKLIYNPKRNKAISDSLKGIAKSY